MTTFKAAADALDRALVEVALTPWPNATAGHVALAAAVRGIVGELRDSYDNPGTVVCVLASSSGARDKDLLMIRRALPDGYGKLALPGGFQLKGETWQEAGARELLEETGYRISPDNLHLADIETVEGGINLIFAEHYGPIEPEATRQTDGEALTVEFVLQAPAPADIAFPTHEIHALRWFIQ